MPRLFPSCLRQITALAATILLLPVPGLPATPLRVATLNVEFGLGAPGSTGFEATAAILRRIDADVIALQELNRTDFEGSPSSFEDLATALGYAHLHAATIEGVLDSGLRAGFISRYPLSSATNIRSPAGARDMVRQIPAILVDVPGTAADPTILTLHLKCCLDQDDPFRRAIELKRATDYLTEQSFTSGDNLIVLGDFNLIGRDLVYEVIPNGLPRSFDLGEDVSFPVSYHIDPASYFQPWSMSAIDTRQLNGSSSTQGGSQLDFILATSSLTSRPHAGEIYNSVLDISNRGGLPKSGQPLPERTSMNASDHLAVFADFKLSSQDSLVLEVSPSEISESDPPGTATLTIELPSAPGPGESVEVSLSSSAPGEALSEQEIVTFGNGETVKTVSVISLVDDLVDGTREVIFTASSPGLSSDTTRLLVNDSSISLYEINQPGAAIQEDFNRFDGLSAPPRWTISPGPWRGSDNGGSGLTGLYSYGDDGSLGFLLNTDPLTASTVFRNDTGLTISALEISCKVEQWRAFEEGRSDTLSAEAFIGGNPVPLPSLSFTADSSAGDNGPVEGGRSTPLRANLAGLSIAPGDSFELRFTATPGNPPSFMEQYVRINEIHYDNDGPDLNEFLEILVAPGFQGSIPEIEIYLYNGNGGGVYGQHSLASFSLDQTLPSGHRLFSKLIPRIQNGPDGIAIAASGTVLEFLSYEGTITASDGPAIRMTSRDIGVSQSNPVPAATTGSLGLNGDLSWTRFSSPPSPGALNQGQAFSPAPIPGIAVDEITIVALQDTDLDGIHDLLEEEMGSNPQMSDSDGDGTPDGREDADGDNQDNLTELLLTQTNPLDHNSRFQITITPAFENSDEPLLSFPTLQGRVYTVFHSKDLRNWTPLLSLPGSGQRETLTVTGNPPTETTFFRVEISFDRR